MAETNNLKLALPTSNEYVDVEVLNENFRKIDTSILLALAAAAPYSAAATYAQGAYCTKDGKLYRCTVAIPQAEAWNAAHWTATTMGAELVAIYTTLANKAPNGYGLGQVAYGPTFDGKPYNADGITGSGFFSCKNGTPVEDWGTILHIQGDSTTRATQWFKPAFNWSGKLNITKDTVFKRERFESTWEPWEYINPPMELGIEYRTTDRYLGKPVYVKVVDCGVMTNNKTIVITDDSKRILDVILKGNPTPFPMVPNGSGLGEWDGGFTSDGVNITLYAGDRLAASNHHAVAIAKLIDA